MKASKEGEEYLDQGQSGDEPDFDQELVEVERSLQELKDRHNQVQQAQAAQANLQQRQEQIKRQHQRAASPELKVELQHIQDSLDELEVKLESRLFSWEKPFWQIVRFGGLGLVIGWLMAIAVLQRPQPASQPSPGTSQNSQ
ncbi:hypothetical protein JOY44_06910 [Phormidium sp. CLA17]|uniref:hypothetical protein n=1 Tax=Leptolyngbya sp. Cla-17 TaxID=2803751 RepID=UPI001492128C|nr:hypothetical protein [Leptolyngbya sp. Cla-17]MBM0741350.1 hypothetical protein [Leptolyngbya sp. Cla-17]